MSDEFVWRDAGRVVVFRHRALAEAPQLLREHGFDHFEMLTTPRHLVAVPELEAAAHAVHAVPSGQVPEAAAELLGRAGADHLVGLGGGRVIDTAKSIASVSGARVAAIPTTLSGAEMTTIHRLPAGAEDRVRSLVRPQLAIDDPELMTSQPEGALRASAMNALAHGADSLYTPYANPVSRMAALRGAELIAASLDEASADRARAGLALGSILCAYAVDSAGLAVHHVVCQTLVRVCGSPHAETNAAVLPRSMAFMAPRAPDHIAALAEVIGCGPARIESRLIELGGNPPGLGAIGADRARLDETLDAMVARPDLANTPGGTPSREELAELVERAW
ncbi:MAG TPA: iron-containing alcohol dehydrogenase [Solirubrobacterales bacterium]